MTITIDRINQLSAERSELFRRASNGRRGDPVVRDRIAAIDAELATLWQQRRTERAGRREGIDLLVDRSYAQAYGRNYEDAIAPPAVGDEEAERVPARAAA